MLSALVAFTLLTACSPTQTPPESSPTTASSPPSSITAHPTPTPTAPVNLQGPVLRSEKFDITAFGGYRAVVSLRWHTIQESEISRLFPDCAANYRTNSTSIDKGLLRLRATVVEGSASFPEVNGIPWTTDAAGAITVAASPIDVTICPPTAAQGAADLHQTSLSPANTTFSFMFVHSAQKSPTNPEGAMDDRYLKDEVRVSGSNIQTCNGGQPRMSTSFCYSTYGG